MKTLTGLFLSLLAISVALPVSAADETSVPINVNVNGVVQVSNTAPMAYTWNGQATEAGANGALEIDNLCVFSNLDTTHYYDLTVTDSQNNQGNGKLKLKGGDGTGEQVVPYDITFTDAAGNISNITDSNTELKNQVGSEQTDCSDGKYADIKIQLPEATDQVKGDYTDTIYLTVKSLI